MANFGLSLGASMRGYNDGRNQLMDRKERDRDYDEHEEDRKRKKKLETQYDPLDLEEAMLRIQEARRTGELNKYIHDKGYSKKSADRGDQTGDLGLKSMQRQDAVGEKSHPGDLLAVGYRDNQARQADQLGTAQHPGNLQQVKFQDQMLGDSVSDYGANRKFWDSYENVNRALANFSMTGNPKILMDAYDMYIDDGVDAVITKNKDGSYVVNVNNGNPPQPFANKEELAKATEIVFMKHLQANQPAQGGMGMGGYGSGYYGGGGGGYGLNSSGPGMPGRGRGMGSVPADIQTTEYLIQAMRGIDKYSDLSPEQMRMAAFSLQSNKADNSPQTDIRQFFVKTFMERIKPDQMGRKMDAAQAFKEAETLAKQYAYSQHGIGDKPTLDSTEDEDGQSDLESWIEEAAGLNPRPQ